MKKILLAVVAVMFIVNAHARTILVLEFKTQDQRKIWTEWLLDHNGEDQSGFYASDWSDNTMKMVMDHKQDPGLSLLNKKVKIADFIKSTCSNSLHLNPQACYDSVANCFVYMNTSRMYFGNTYPERELKILSQCLSIE